MNRLLRTITLVSGLVAIPSVAEAHIPEIYGHTACVGGQPTFGWDVVSSDPAAGWTHPDVRVQASLDGGEWFQIDAGWFDTSNGFGFSGSTAVTGATDVRLRTRAVGPWSDAYWWEGPFYADGWNLYEEDATVFSIPTDCSPPPPVNPGTGTPGYWRNHPEAWPVATVFVGDYELTIAEAIEVLSSPAKGDKTITMARAVIAATLNIAIGNDDSCIDVELDAAQDWLVANPVGSGVKANSTAWANGESLATYLDDYNNGLLCAPSRG